MMKLAVKPPYSVARSLCSEPPTVEGEMEIVQIVDNMMKGLSILKLSNNMDEELRNQLLKKHVEAAEEYYKSFTREDFAALMLVDMMMTSKEGGDDDEEHSV